MGAVSFDVFDTCITRTFAYPRDLFYTLGLKVAPDNLTAATRHRFAARFQQHRINAEKAAYRQVSANGQPNLVDIYARFRNLPGLALGVDDLANAEIALERESLYPIPSMVTRINQLRASGHRIIFISDMYLPREVLGPILRDLGIMQPEDALYVSCDAGCRKQDGKLFEHVLREEGLQPSQLIHHGDNLVGDVRMARAHGIKACHADVGLLTAGERSVAGQYRRRQLPRPPAASFLAGFARQLRLQAPASPTALPSCLDELLRGTVIPLLLAYTIWLLDRARTLDINRLYFVARDGYVLHQMAKVLGVEGQFPDLRYLHGSRRAWLLPSWPWTDDECDRAVLIPGKPCTPGCILQRLNISVEQQRPVLNALGWGRDRQSESLTYAAGKEFLRQLRQVPAAAAAMQRSADNARELVLDYMKQQGTLDSTSWALVDSGWSLNAQAALKRILNATSQEHQVRGFYLTLVRNHLPSRIAGQAEAFATPAGRLLASRTHLMDHCVFPAPHASTRGYARQGAEVHPVFDDDTRTQEELVYANRLQELAVTAAHMAATDSNLRTAMQTHAGAIIRQAERFIGSPDRDMALALSKFHAYTDLQQQRSLSEALCKPLGLNDVAAIATKALFGKSVYTSPMQRWLEGSAVLSRPWIRWPMRLTIALAHRRRPRPDKH